MGAGRTNIGSEKVTLTGDASDGDVLSGKTYYNSDPKTKRTGSLALTGNTSDGDVLSGKTYYNTDAKTKRTGTLALTGDADAGNVLSGKTFYTTDVVAKLTGTMVNRSGEQQSVNTTKSGTKLILTPPAGYYDGSSAKVVRDPAYVVGDMLPNSAISNYVDSIAEMLFTVSGTPIYLWSPGENYTGSYDATREYFLMTSSKSLVAFLFTGTILRTYDYASSMLGTITACQFDTSGVHLTTIFVATREGTTNRLYVVRTDLQRCTLVYTATSQNYGWSGIGVTSASSTQVYVVAGIQKGTFTYANSQSTSLILPFLNLSNIGHATLNPTVGSQVIRYGYEFFYTADQTNFPNELIGVMNQNGFAAFGQRWSSQGFYYMSHCNAFYNGQKSSVGTGSNSNSLFSTSSFWTSTVSGQIEYWYTPYVNPLTITAYGYQIDGADHAFLQYARVGQQGSVQTEWLSNRPTLRGRYLVSSKVRREVMIQNINLGSSTYAIDPAFTSFSHATPNTNCWSANGLITNLYDATGQVHAIPYSVYAVGSTIYKTTTYGRTILA